jgi:hypothetical protein
MTCHRGCNKSRFVRFRLFTCLSKVHVVKLNVFTFLVLCCDVCYNFRAKTMFYSCFFKICLRILVHGVSLVWFVDVYTINGRLIFSKKYHRGSLSVICGRILSMGGHYPHGLHRRTSSHLWHRYSVTVNQVMVATSGCVAMGPSSLNCPGTLWCC